MAGTIDALNDARAALRPYIHRTPLLRSSTLSRLTGCTVYLKAELFQKTGSYKPRGMLWALDRLPSGERRRGVITFSAGNAAQGLAYAAAIHGVPATVVMPAAASPAKAAATRKYGAEVIMFGTPSECLAHCQALAAERGLSFLSSYDSDDLMAGHSSLGLEILEDLPEVDAIYVGIGGGGMMGGLVKALSATSSTAKLVGVEPAGAPAMHRSIEQGMPVRLDSVSTIADGLAAPTAGELCFELAKARLDEMVLVEDAEISAAMRLLMARCKLFAEPAGSAALAGLIKSVGGIPRGSNVVCIVSGGNIDFDRLGPALALSESGAGTACN